jgi:hypothetical protein
MLHPAQDRAGCEGDTAFGHHRDEVMVQEVCTGGTSVPADAQDDDGDIEMAGP